MSRVRFTPHRALSWSYVYLHGIQVRIFDVVVLFLYRLRTALMGTSHVCVVCGGVAMTLVNPGKGF